MIKQLFWTSFLLLLPFCANALGFGNLSVDSFLDQPLKARVQLVSESGLQVDEVRASLADAETFRKVGIARPFSLSKLRFKVVAAEGGRAYIEITSRNSIREPYLDFLVQVAWRGATLVKEFTILLDPPVYQPVVAGTAVAKAPPKAAPAASPATAALPAPTYGPVKNSETLWVIAQNTRPDPGYSIEQMMMALQRRNPGAFRRGNVNLLKQGVVLSIPQRADIEQLTSREARRAFLQQTREWRATRGRGQNTPVAEVAPVPAASQADTPLQQRPAPRVLTEVVDAAIEGAGRSANLRVVEPGGEWPADGDTTASESYPAREEEKLREAIADSASDLAAVREINRDLEELRGALESKIAALRKSLEERDRTIETLTRRLDDQVASNTGAADVAPDAATTQALPDPATIASRLRLAGDLAPRDATAAEPQPAENAKTALWAQSYWLSLLVIAGLALLLLTAALLRKRRESDSIPEPDAFDSFLQTDQEPQIAAPRSLPQAKTQAAEQFRSYERLEEFGSETGVDVASALTEADVYLAYRRYSQAENLLKDAIRHNPKSMILCAKLLEIYAFRKDRRSFTSFMEEMHQTMAVEAPEIWAKIVEMGRDLIPKHPLIVHSVLPEEMHLQGFDEQEPVPESRRDPALEEQADGTAHNSESAGLSILQVEFDQEGKLKKD